MVNKKAIFENSNNNENSNDILVQNSNDSLIYNVLINMLID